MRLSEWCQTHSLLEFMQLMEDQPRKGKEMTDIALETIDATTATDPVAIPAVEVPTTALADAEAMAFVQIEDDGVEVI